MALTLGNIIIIGIIGLCGIIFTVCCIVGSETGPAIASLIITLVVCLGLGLGFSWVHKHTASGIRNYKDYQSELSNGIEREIRITAEDGREIFYYEGKVDIESNHTDNYIKFESEEGKRYIIYYGIQDTITIIEK